MATPKESDKKNVLNKIVLYCLCGFFFIICGYGLYRQHLLEERVLVLEKEFREFKKNVETSEKTPVEGKELVLKRQARDAECICPAASSKSTPIRNGSAEFSPRKKITRDQRKQKKKNKNQ